jgi:putative DeoR family transcriptional regulator (stage III sporulation protein D)
MDIESRVIKAAYYIIEQKCTVREAARFMGYGKSTLHTDVTERLKLIDTDLYKQVRKILNINYNENHIRGGESTRKKYIETRD